MFGKKITCIFLNYDHQYKKIYVYKTNDLVHIQIQLLIYNYLNINKDNVYDSYSFNFIKNFNKKFKIIYNSEIKHEEKYIDIFNKYSFFGNEDCYSAVYSKICFMVKPDYFIEYIEKQQLDNLENKLVMFQNEQNYEIICKNVNFKVKLNNQITLNTNTNNEIPDNCMGLFFDYSDSSQKNIYFLSLQQNNFVAEAIEEYFFGNYGNEDQVVIGCYGSKYHSSLLCHVDDDRSEKGYKVNNCYNLLQLLGIKRFRGKVVILKRGFKDIISKEVIDEANHFLKLNKNFKLGKIEEEINFPI